MPMRRFQISESDQMLIEAGMLALLVLCAGASALDSSLTFSFFKQHAIFRKNADVCRMCYGEYDCLTMDKTRCEYNAETAAIFYDADEKESNNFAIRTEVDTLLIDLTIQECIMEKFEECIPIISSYTDCNRENICSGCRICDCTLEGKWNCSSVQRCIPEKTEVNHRVLVFVMEKLKSDPRPFRVKRNAYYEKTTLQTANFDKLLDWFYEETEPEHETFKKIAHMKEPSTKTKRNSDNAPTIIPLDDVFNVIGLDTNESSTDNATSPNHIDSPDSNQDIDEFLQMLALEEGKETKSPSLDASTKLIVNFSNDNNVDNNTNVAVDADSLNKKDTNEKLNREVLLENDFNLMDSLGFINLMNVMKRDVDQVNETVGNTTSEANNMFVNIEDKPVTVKDLDVGDSNISIAVKSKNISMNMTHVETVLRSDILDAISKLIKNKYNEIEQLVNIKEILIKLMQNYNLFSTIHHDNKLYSNEIKPTNPIFKSEVNLNKYGNFRRDYSNNNVNLVEKYVKKLKIDVNEVIRDILLIRKYHKSKVLPSELKLLLQSMTYYLKKNKTMPHEKKNSSSFIGQLKNFRRQFSPTNNDTSSNIIFTAVLKMLEVVDKDMPTSNALGPLSPRAKKVLKRVVSRNYVGDFGYKANGHNRLTTDLNSIGLNWQELTLNIVNCAAADRLHKMKLLYLTLSNDIIQLEDASVASNFFYRRQMSLGDEMERKAILQRINTDLNRVDNVIRHYRKENKVINLKNNRQKMSLLKKIKGMWKASKNDLINILRKRSKPRIVKEMELKKAQNEKTQSFLAIVQKWQDNLDIMPFRNKRSIREYTKLKNRMKNIIPHYLRGKLHPALSAKGIGVRKKPITYKMRPKSTVHPAAKIAITTSKPKASKTKKMKQKH